MSSNTESVKSRDDIRNQFDNIRQRSLHGFPWHRDILPRYIHGSLSLHLWVFVSYPCGFWWELTAGSESGDGKRNNVKVAPDNDWQSMLVRVYEFTQNPERAIPSIVRLHSGDLSKHRVGNLVLSKTVQTLFTFLESNSNGEVRFCLS